MIMRWVSAGALLLLSASAWAVSPYIQGNSVAGGNVQAVAAAVESKLKSGGFKVVGKYFPKSLAGYGVVIATTKPCSMKWVRWQPGRAGCGDSRGCESGRQCRVHQPGLLVSRLFPQELCQERGGSRGAASASAKCAGRGKGQGGMKRPAT